MTYSCWARCCGGLIRLCTPGLHPEVCSCLELSNPYRDKGKENGRKRHCLKQPGDSEQGKGKVAPGFLVLKLAFKTRNACYISGVGRSLQVFILVKNCSLFCHIAICFVNLSHQSGEKLPHPKPPQLSNRATTIHWKQQMLERIFGPAASLCRSWGWGIFDWYFNPIVSKKVETLWCGGDPVWGGEDMENLALSFLSFPQWVLVLCLWGEQVYEGKTRNRWTHSRWGPYVNICIHLQEVSVNKRPITWKLTKTHSGSH